MRTLRQLRREGKISYMQPVAGKKGSKVTYLDEDIEAFERQRRKSNLDADQIEHEQALASLEREFGLKINK